MKVKELIDRLNQDYSPDDHIAAHLWVAEDVISKAEDMEEELSKPDAEKIIDEIHDNIDSGLGITWDTLACRIEEFLKRKDTMENELVVIVIEKGMVTEVYSPNANEKIIVVDKDNQSIGEDGITEYTWPRTQFDEERVRELLHLKGENNEPQ